MQAKLDAAGAAVVVHQTSAEALGEAMVALIDDQEALSRMGAFGSERAQQSCQWSVEKERLLLAYRTLLPETSEIAALEPRGEV